MIASASPRQIQEGPPERADDRVLCDREGCGVVAPWAAYLGVEVGALKPGALACTTGAAHEAGSLGRGLRAEFAGA